MENNNPVCDSLYLKQGWVPVIDEPTTEAVEVVTGPVAVKEEIPSEEQPAVEIQKVYKKGDFMTMKAGDIIEIADKLGYKITTTKRADVIEEFLAQQNAK